MLVNFYDASLPVFILYFISFIILFFLIINIKSSNLNKSKNSINMKTQVNKTISNDLIIRFSIVITVLVIIFLLNFRGISGFVWFNHLNINNINLFLFLLFNVLFLIIYSILIKIPNLKNLQFDYFISISILNIILPLVFFSNNILTFFFILELVSSLILFKFIVGRDWELLISSKKSDFFNFSSNYKSTSYINIIFFQYWISFFSSVLIVYSLLMFFYFYGSSEYVVLNFLTSIDLNYNSLNFNISIIMSYLAFFIGFFLKLGIAPIHFYKIELYKGLPFLTILIYTFYFFFIFFLFFILIVTYNLNNISIIWYNIGLIILIIGVFFVFFLLFDIYNLKAFFAYSTIVNSMLFLSLTISLI